MNLADITCVVIDNGLSVSMAPRLARFPGGFGSVKYWCPNIGGFTTPHLSNIGTGFKVDRVDRFFSLLKEIEKSNQKDKFVFCFLDVGAGDLQDDMRYRGFHVWGPGLGEDLEIYRWSAKELQKRLGLAVPKTALIKGLENLRRYLQANENVYVKVSVHRGISETWKSHNYALSRARLDATQHFLGPLADEQEWIVEHEIKTTLETGGDSYNVHGKWPATSCFGIEKKDCGYILAVVPTKELPDTVQNVHNALSPVFEQYGYAGFYSSEIRKGEDGQDYLIDNTNRYASPPGEIMQEMITNLPKIIEAGSRGQLVDMVCKYKYACELILYSDFAPEEWQAVQYPDAIAHCVKLYNNLKRGNTMWVTPVDAKFQQIGAVSGFGNTIKEAMTNAKENAKLVKGDRIEVKDDLIPSLIESLHAAKEKGISFGDSPIPDEI